MNSNFPSSNKYLQWQAICSIFSTKYVFQIVQFIEFKNDFNRCRIKSDVFIKIFYMISRSKDEWVTINGYYNKNFVYFSYLTQAYV